MLVAPGRTPRDIVQRLHAELTGILALPETESEIVRLGMLPFTNPPVDELRPFVERETVRWRKIVERAGIAESQ
jgi:tripartite-type tricarboxylate transporter receptor subunit TctC